MKPRVAAWGSVITFMAVAIMASLVPALPMTTLCGSGTAALLEKVSFTGWPAFTVKDLVQYIMGLVASGERESSCTGPAAAGALAAAAAAGVALAGAAGAAAAGAGAASAT